MSSTDIDAVPISHSAGLIEEIITFHSPFLLPGLDRPHRPGAFLVRERREALDVSWPAFVVSLSIILVDGGITQALEVSREELDAALRRDNDLERP